MQVKEIMTRNVLSIRPEDALSQALAIMRKHRIHQLPVMGNGTLYGMLELKKIVSRDVDIANTKVAGVATSVPHIDANASVESAVEMLLGNGLRAVPVTEAGSVVGIISESDLMKVAKQFVKGLNQRASEILSPAECLNKRDNYGTIKRLLSEKNISRAPILDGNKAVGVVSTLELIKILEGKDRMSARGGLLQEGGAKDKVRLEETELGAIMRPATVVTGDRLISDIIETLKDSEEIIVETDSGFGVITPKDVLELFAAVPKKQLYVQITGMHNESIEFRVKMDQAVSEFVQKMGRMVRDIEYLVVHVEKMHKQGPKEKYSIRIRFKSPVGFFVAHAWGWKPLDVIQEAFKKLEREVVRKHGKIEDTHKKKKRMPRMK